jgi:fatty acid desaturase
VMVWMALFGYPLIKNIIQKAKARQSSRGKVAVNEQYGDRLNVLMRSYKEVPVWWFIALFLSAFIPTVVMILAGYLYIPIWTYFIALATGVVVVIVCFSPFHECTTLTCLIAVGVSLLRIELSTSKSISHNSL